MGRREYFTVVKKKEASDEMSSDRRECFFEKEREEEWVFVRERWSLSSFA